MTDADAGRTVDRVSRIVGLVLELEDVDPRAHFYDELEVDSLQKAEIVVLVEREFDLAVPVEDAADMACSLDIAEFVRRRLDAGTAAGAGGGNVGASTPER